MREKNNTTKTKPPKMITFEGRGEGG